MKSLLNKNNYQFACCKSLVMSGVAGQIFWLVICLILGTTVQALDRTELYPYGDVQGDHRLPVGDDVSSSSVQLRTPVTFYDETYTSFYINLNGLISFETELPAYRSNLIIPFNYKIIAPFFADVDINLSGNVYYRETQDPSLLRKVVQDVQKAFPGRYSFRPTSLFIATWDDVAAYQNQFQPTNTFQVLIASDGRDSFCIFLYPSDGINWVKGQGKDAPQHDDVPAQAGFDSGVYGLYYTLPGSGNPEVNKLSSWSNIGKPGVWVFQIGATMGKNILTPDSSSDSDGAPMDVFTLTVRDSGINSCAEGGDRLCHTNARCQDYQRGFCCACAPNFVGNGYQCIPKDEHQRVNGKVTGTINGEVIDGVDLHAYVVTNDGRTYTAISRIPQSIGYSMQSLYTVGSTLGFLFAYPQQSGDKNGFMIAGGQFNRTASVQFQSGEQFSIKQTFTGQDAQGHMRMATRVDGNLPRIARGAKLELDDYKEEYRRASPGVIKSYSTQTFKVDGTPYQITVDQTINYSECEAQPLNDVSSIKLNVARNFVVYSDTEQIVRYSQTNKISTTDGESSGDIRPEPPRPEPPRPEPPRPSNPCQTARCDSNADCTPDGSSYRCTCRQGFQGDGYRCSPAGCDVLRNCHRDATCEYDPSGYRCRCNLGFRAPTDVCTFSDGLRCEAEAPIHGGGGDGWQSRVTERTQPASGFDCTRDPRVCDRNARCSQIGRCQCNPGYSGDGYRTCIPSGDKSNYLIYAQGMYIMEAPFDAREDSGKQTLYIPGQLAIGIDVDCKNKYFYWTDVTGKTISKARLDGTDSRTIATNLGSPEGVSVDWLSENVYWTDSVLDRIEVSRLDGSQRKTLFNTELVNPRAIAVDPIRGLMFWTDWNRASPKIEKANMDGSERQTLVGDGLGLPNGLTIDFDANNVCWADAGTRKVECVNYDGRNRRVVSQSAGYPFDVVYNRDVFYWTDWERTSLPNTNKNSNRPNEDLTLPVGSNGKMYGITAVKNSCPSGSNPCSYNNGGCRYLCLPTSRGSRTCACPDTVSAEECARSGGQL